MRISGDVNLYRLLHSFKHGYRILSPDSWISLSKIHILAYALGFTGFILAIKEGKIGSLSGLLSNSDKGDSLEKVFFVPGLRNLGNNCFLNVILQALASCDCFPTFLQNIIERDGFSVDDRDESMPLTGALFALCRELRKSCKGRMTLSPRRVMQAMDQYIPTFNLTSQQDAAEAFLHILSSLKEETSECYVPNYGSLAEICSLSKLKIASPMKREGLNEQEQWQQNFLGPFNGILGSTLTCNSCSSQLSADFEFFVSLPLSPLHDGSETIINGCSVEHCLKKFTAAERVDNYRCNHCWHIAARKYFATIEGHESQIEKLNSCIGEDSCDCRNLFPQGVPWSNNISRTLKQLSITRCPEILCLHLQRASVNEFGELVKLKGHISFPMLLDLSPFRKSVVGIVKENFGKTVERMQVNQPQLPITRLDQLNMPFATNILQQIYGRTGQNINIVSEPLFEGEDDNKCTHATDAGEGTHIASESLVGVMAHIDDSAEDKSAQSLQPGETNLVPEPLCGVEVGDTNDLADDKSYPFIGTEIEAADDSAVHKTCEALKPEENVDSTSESLVGLKVGDSNHSAVDCTQALKPGGGINVTLESLNGDDIDTITDFGEDQYDQAPSPQKDLNIVSESLVEAQMSGDDFADDECAEALEREKNTRTMKSQHKNNNNSRHIVAPRSCMYQLVSVVEHFGKVGSGHYTVYRRATISDDTNSVERSHVQWFCISDSDVFHVSEQDVLAAEASLLFYEKI